MPDCVLPMFALFFYIVGKKSKMVMWMSHGGAAIWIRSLSLRRGVDRGELSCVASSLFQVNSYGRPAIGWWLHFKRVLLVRGFILGGLR